MAALFPLHCFGLMFSPVISSSRRELQQSPASSFSSSKLRSSPVSLNRREALLSPRTRASSEVGQRRKTNSGVQEEDLIHLRNDAFVEQRGGTSRELVEDPKFVPLNDDDPVFGPPALLLMGFDSSETSKMLQFVKELDGEFLKIILCTEVMLTQSVWDAIHTEQPDLKAVKVAKSLPRICFLSGLSGEEMMMFIDAFPETGLRPAVFAALVPNSADKLLRDVAEEIMGDHEMLSAKQTS